MDLIQRPAGQVFYGLQHKLEILYERMKSSPPLKEKIFFESGCTGRLIKQSLMTCVTPCHLYYPSGHCPLPQKQAGPTPSLTALQGARTAGGQRLGLPFHSLHPRSEGSEFYTVPGFEHLRISYLPTQSFQRWTYGEHQNSNFQSWVRMEREKANGLVVH